MSRKRRNETPRSSFSDLTHPNFEELARIYPTTFGQAWNEVRHQQRQVGGSFASNITEDFTRATTRALLHAYFGLDLAQIPSLCPPIPNRYFLVQWIQQTLLPLTNDDRYFTTSTNSNTNNSSTTSKIGMDIGTGATAIYPLLFCAPQRPVDDNDNTANDDEWTWFASEIDTDSVTMAIQNVQANANQLLPCKIQVLAVPPTTAQETQLQQPEPEPQTINDNHEEDTTMHDATATHADTSSSSLNRAGPPLQLWQALPNNSRPTTPVHIVMTNPPFHDPSTTASQPTTR